MLGIPQEIEILAILPFGYPVAAIGKGQKKRKPLRHEPLAEAEGLVPTFTRIADYPEVIPDET